jgi:hypothetical protein
MMMMQQCMDNEQRDWQYKNESEQWEQEYQLCWEEMSIACEEARAKRQMMNMIFMSILSSEEERGGTTATRHPAPATLRKYFNVCFVSPGMGGSDWKGASLSLNV